MSLKVLVGVKRVVDYAIKVYFYFSKNSSKLIYKKKLFQKIRVRNDFKGVEI